MLGAHVERCESCRAFAAEAVGFTAALRTAPLERLERPVTSIARRRPIVRRTVQFGAAAALVAAAVGLGSIFGAMGSGGRAHDSEEPASPRADRLSGHDQVRQATRGPRTSAASVQRVTRRGLTLVEDTF